MKQLGITVSKQLMTRQVLIDTDAMKQVVRTQRVRGWSNFSRLAACLALATAAASTACTSSSAPAESNAAGATTPETSSTIVWDTCPDDYFVKNPGESFDADAVECATVEVPAVYHGESELPDFGLALMRQPTTGDARYLGTLFVNPGGPGGSGVELVQHQSYPEEILDSYDIIGFDPRGVLHSQPVSGEPIRCSDALDFSSYWTLEATPENQAQVDEIQEFDKEFYTDCENANPAWWTLGTENVVRDLDLLREQLTGNADLNFLGSSYGTTIAAEYLRAFPQHNGHIVLDSPTDNSPDTDASLVAQTRAMNDHLIRLVDGYAKAEGVTRAAVQRDLLQIRDWGDNDQLKGFAGLEEFPDDSTSRLSNEYLFSRGMLALTYYDTARVQRLFNRGIDELLENRWNGLFEYLALDLDGYDTDLMIEAYQAGEPYDPHGYTRDNSFEIREMVSGIDRDQRDLRTRAQEKKLDSKVKAAAPFLWSLSNDPSNFEYNVPHGGNHWSWAAFGDPDIADPPKSPAPRTNTSGKPVLVVGSLHESTTPYQYAVRTARDLKSELVTWNGDEHAPLGGFQHPCLNRIFVAYLIHDQVPERPVTCD